MKNHLLLPSKYKVFGWILFLVSAVLYIYCCSIYPSMHDGKNLGIPGFTWSYPSLFTFGDNELTTAIFSSGVLMGLLMICFSKEKNEDEYISLIRLRSWQWAVLVYFGILFFVNLLVYGMEFSIFALYNVLTIFIVFIVKFYYSLFKLSRERLVDEK
ncbi:hypothetical protein [Pedobacter polysacchareus]|uniref:hypothetical protein n=1 Tax=Pedobacter polysacchareus TaxID=2861973 RepID=UPI001C99BBA0|nr:hypothetical protein [Pedobacter polysacchareus]